MNFNDDIDDDPDYCPRCEVYLDIEVVFGQVIGHCGCDREEKQAAQVTRGGWPPKVGELNR